MKRILIPNIAAVLAITMLAAEAAMADHCAGGACGAGFRRARVVRVERYRERDCANKAAHHEAGDCNGGLLSRTRLRDGDGRPLLRAR